MDEKQKKQAIIGGGIAGGLALIALIWFFLVPHDDGGSDTTPPPPSKNPTGGTAQRPPRPAADNTASSGAPTPGGPAAGNGAASPDGKPVPMRVAQAQGRPQDPFYYERHIIPPPPNVFDEVKPYTVAVENYKKRSILTTTTIVRQAPTRRVSGLMTGDGTYAILESPSGETEIVKPGSTTKDGFIVKAINPDSVLLEREVPALHTTFTQLVLFTDAPVSSTPGSGRPNGPGGPNNPGGGRGGRPPGGGRPGGPPPGGGDNGG